MPVSSRVSVLEKRSLRGRKKHAGLETHCRQGLCLCLTTLSAGLQTDFARLPLAPYLPFHFVAPVTRQSDPTVTFV